MRNWLLFLAIVFVCKPAFATKRALLIGIGTYQSGRLGTSADRDRYYMTQILNQQQFDDIKILSDNQATAIGIRRALRELIYRCQPGDKVVLHYAGHGTQLSDQNGDEQDHYDEALIPYDAPQSDKVYRTKPDPFIRDDEIAIFLSQVRDMLGPTGHILLVIDACHAGTLTRGQARIRTDHYRSKKVSNPSVGISGWLDVIPAFMRGKSGKVILMAASQADEENTETFDDEKEAVGSLTYAFSRAMSSVSNKDTYQSLFGRVKTELRRKVTDQIPTLEGDKTEQVWAGEVISSSAWAIVQQLGYKLVRIAKGWMAGYGAGSVVRISRGDSVSVLGRIIESQPFQSRVQLQDSLFKQDLLNIQVHLISQALPELPLRLSLRNLSTVQRNKVMTALNEVANIQLVDEGADWIIEESGRQFCLLQAADGQRVACLPVTTPDALVNQLILNSRMALLRDLTLPDATLQAIITLQNAQLIKDGQQLRTILSTARYRDWSLFHPGQQAWLRLTNVGKAPFYCALVDIQPDAKPVILLPNVEYAATDLYLEPGQTLAFPVKRFSPPYGRETYKLLLTSTPADWGLQIPLRSNDTFQNNSSNPFSFFLNGPIRGSSESTLLLNEVGVSTLNFWIRPTH